MDVPVFRTKEDHLGKPYDSELSKLPSTYEWARDIDITALVRALRRASSLPLIAIGSGGSFTTAAFAADCHEHFNRRIAKAVTPLELIAGNPEKDASYVILTAGGKNRDILAALRFLLSIEPVNIIILCTSMGSPLSELARQYAWVDVIEYELPSGKDGFVATNSLLGACTLIARGFSDAAAKQTSFPIDFAQLATVPNGLRGEQLPEPLRAVLGRDGLLVMHDHPTRAAALDLESKFSEAALGPVQICDLRSFAHGRHHWLAKRGDSTGVLALHLDESSDLVRRTTRLLPKTIPVADLVSNGAGVIGGLGAVVDVLHFVGAAGRVRGIDPGRPGVPPYGSRIYNLPAFSRKQTPGGASLRAQRAIVRKTRATEEELERLGLLDFWRRAHTKFCDRLGAAAFGAVVFDYDGTLCDPASRFQTIPQEMAEALNALLKHRIPVGIATGRGGSVREALSGQISDSSLEDVIIGYHNGTEIAPLSDSSQPPEEAAIGEALLPVWRFLSDDARTAGFALLRGGAGQITVRPNEGAEEMIWPVVKHYAALCKIPVVRSTHSLDILAPEVGKRRLVNAMRERLRDCQRRDILIIGDQGEWPGNDYELLAEPFSLSVNEVSPAPDTCWNVLPSGLRGAQGVLWYLAQLRIGSRGFSFKTTSIR